MPIHNTASMRDAVTAGRRILAAVAVALLAVTGISVAAWASGSHPATPGSIPVSSADSPRWVEIVLCWDENSQEQDKFSATHSTVYIGHGAGADERTWKVNGTGLDVGDGPDEVYQVVNLVNPLEITVEWEDSEFGDRDKQVFPFRWDLGSKDPVIDDYAALEDDYDLQDLRERWEALVVFADGDWSGLIPPNAHTWSPGGGGFGTDSGGDRLGDSLASIYDSLSLTVPQPVGAPLTIDDDWFYEALDYLDESGFDALDLGDSAWWPVNFPWVTVDTSHCLLPFTASGTADNGVQWGLSGTAHVSCFDNGEFLEDESYWVWDYESIADYAEEQFIDAVNAPADHVVGMPFVFEVCVFGDDLDDDGRLLAYFDPLSVDVSATWPTPFQKLFKVDTYYGDSGSYLTWDDLGALVSVGYPNSTTATWTIVDDGPGDLADHHLGLIWDPVVPAFSVNNLPG